MLEVAEPKVWTELEATAMLDGHLGEALGPTRRVAFPSFHDEALPLLTAAGITVLVRDARNGAGLPAAGPVRSELEHLSRQALAVLHRAQRHATDDVRVGPHAWDPEADAAALRELQGAGVLHHATGTGRWTLARGLPPPPALEMEVGDALMPPTDDLADGRTGPVALLHDLASLAAAIDHNTPARTHAGTIARADVRRLAARLASDTLRRGAGLEADARWARALRGLEALGMVTMDPIERTLHVDLGLDDTLAGDTPDAIDRLLHRLADPDLRPGLPIVRSTLLAAGADAIDEIVWRELVRDHHRDVLIVPRRRGGGLVYPDEETRFDDAGWEQVEGRMWDRLLDLLERLGVVRRAPGVFAATDDGRRWAGVRIHPPPPVWVSSDLQVIVPPDGVTPWERFQLERLGRCLRRDVVDVYVLERAGLVAWLRWHDLDEALALLARRSPAVPPAVVEALTTWARQAMRVVLTRGVLL